MKSSTILCVNLYEYVVFHAFSFFFLGTCIIMFSLFFQGMLSSFLCLASVFADQRRVL